MSTVYAQQSSIVGHPDGEAVTVKRGDAYDTTHPIVQAHGWLFGKQPPAEAVAGAPRVERATRAPGEVR